MRNILKNLPYFVLFILFLESLGAGHDNFYVMMVTYGVLIILSCISGILNYKEGKNDRIFFLLIILNFALGLLYVYNTPFGSRQHDTGGLIIEGRGHLHYIAWLLEKHTLPFFYQQPGLPIEHPPLYYVIAALFVKAVSLVRGIKCVSLVYGEEAHNFLCESLQYLTLFFVSGTIFLFYHIVKLLKMPLIYGLLAFMLMSFYPLFILLSGSLNNDAAFLFFCTLSTLFFMRYILSNRIMILCLSAFFAALALLVKSSAVFVPLGVFLFLCFSWIKRYYSFKKIFLVGMCYAVISLTIGLSWNIYNYFKWSSSPTTNSHLYRAQLEREKGYNPILHTANTNDDQNISAYSYWDRLLITIEPEKNPYIRTQQPYEYNIWNALIKSSLFDEYSFFPKENYTAIRKAGYIISLILWYLNCAFFMFFAWTFLVTKKNPILSYLKCTVFSSLLIFIIWCFINPCWSAALARYIPSMFLCMTLVNFKFIDQFSEAHRKFKKFISFSAILYTFSFVILANLLFILFFWVYK